ncbi:LacI family DNA-binding transcriptional regulator [Vallitalea okinawensis]|uniref:LacI family DNA-binding transcriptional regulator n=1 Tax=Vallitalea okinawensis TaxID=2078660 RepID=UPI000CFB10A2|nr:LacI family DNA-binding transcriptional regulator [Vallitalea okinawensis]
MPTIKDVAKQAGVSVTTVSRVLNNRGYLSDDVKSKVHKAMEEINYQPNEIARSLFRKKSNIIGLIVPSASHPFFAALTNLTEAYAFEKGYKVMLCNSNLDLKKEKEYIEMLKRSQVDGIIMGSHTLDVDDYKALKLPIVTLDRRIDEQIPFVSCDNYQGGQLATELLIQKGCKKIAYIGGNLTLDLLSNKRYDAFEEVANRNDIETVLLETDIKGFNFAEYDDLACKLFEEHPDIDGVFASSDIIASYVIKAAIKNQMNIPDDIKVIGYDNINVAEFMTPELTTIAQPIEIMSKKLVDLLIMQMDSENINVENVFPVKLIQRQTT